MTHHPAEPAACFLPQRLSDAQRESFRDHGFLQLGPLLTEHGLRQMQTECMSAWRAEKESFDPSGTWLRNSLLPDIHHRSAFVRQYYFAGPLVDIALQLIGPNIKAVTSQLTFKLRGNSQRFGWHQDNAYGELDPYNAISCLTALDNADPENGCLWLIPGSHHPGQIEYNHTLDDKAAQVSIDMDADPARATPMPLQAGHCLLLHCHLLHMSQGNLSVDRDRRILFTRYADADAVEVYNDRQPRLGRLLRGTTRFAAVRRYEAELDTGDSPRN